MLLSGTDEIIDSGITLALSLWVRSEVLLSLNRPKPALEDLKLALKERLPARMRADYYWRMGHCYKGILITLTKDHLNFLNKYNK